MGPGGRQGGGREEEQKQAATTKRRPKEATRMSSGLVDPDMYDPPEGGWGWMVAIGMAVMFISTTGQYGSFALLFDGFLTKLGQETTGATLIMNAFTAAFNFTGLVTNHMLTRMSYRKVALLGGFLFTAGILLTTFAKTMAHALVTYSVLAGVGFGLIAPSSFLALNSYFLRRRGFAMGICQAGIGLGFMASPPIIQYLIEEYSFSGTMLILSAVALHSLLGAALYQPIKWHVRKAQPKSNGHVPSTTKDRTKKVCCNGVANSKRPPTTNNPPAEERRPLDAEEDARISTIYGQTKDFRGSNGEATTALLSKGSTNASGPAERNGTVVKPQSEADEASQLMVPITEEDGDDHHWIPNGKSEHLEGLLPATSLPTLRSFQESANSEELKSLSEASKLKCYQRQSASLVNLGTIVLIFDNGLGDQGPKEGEMEVMQRKLEGIKVGSEEKSAKETVEALSKEENQKRKKNKKVRTTMGGKLRSAWERLVGKTTRVTDESTPSSPPQTKGVMTLFGYIVDFLDLRLLKDPSYVNLALGLSVSCVSDTNFFTVLPFHLQKTLGFSQADVAVCLSAAAGADVASRLLLPLLGDHLRLQKRTAYLLGCLTSAIARSIFVLVEDFPSVVAFCALVGFLKGTMVVNLALTIAEHCRLEKFAAAFGLYMIMSGLITIFLGPLIGVVRDWSDSYELCIHVLSGVLLLCAIPWLLEMAIIRWKLRRQKRDHPIL